MRYREVYHWDYYLMLTSWMIYREVYHIRLLSDTLTSWMIYREVYHWDYYLMLTSWMRYRGVYHMRLLSDVDAMNEIHRNISQDYYLICWHHERDTGRMSISHNTPNRYIMNEMVVYHTTLSIQRYDEWDTVQHVLQPLLTQLWCQEVGLATCRCCPNTCHDKSDCSTQKAGDVCSPQEQAFI